LPDTNIQSGEHDDLRKVNRWVGYSVGTNNLDHLVENLEVLTRGKSENVNSFFDVKRLRGIINVNMKKTPLYIRKA
jgi:hypothetical protein